MMLNVSFFAADLHPTSLCSGEIRGAAMVRVGAGFDVAAYVTAAEAREIAAAWAAMAERIADRERERTMPTLAEVTVDRDASLAEDHPLARIMDAADATEAAL